MKLGLLILSLLVIDACSPIEQQKKPPRASNGVLNLSNWDFAKDGAVDLSGEYEFYWEQLLAPEQFASSPPPEKSGFIHVGRSGHGHDRPVSVMRLTG